MIKNISNFLVALLYIFRVFLPLINPLVATCNKTRTLTSRKYIAQQDIMIPNWSKIIQNFWSHSSILLCIEKLQKNLNFQSFFTSNRPFGRYFWNANEMRALTSKKNVAEQGIVTPNWSKTSQTFKWHSSGLALEKQPKNVSFQSFFYL